MSLIQATIRSTKTRGELNALRKSGNVPGVIYGGESTNEKISLSKKEVKNLINKENFLSNVISIKLDEKEQKVLPREITFDTISDEPTHIDFLRIVKGSKIILEIPVRFINNDIVRRKVELKCPTENIPTELVVDLEGLEIGTSIKISSIKLPENVTPTIQGRDFVIATVAAPTIVKEPEKPAEAETEGAETAATEGAETATAEGENKTADSEDKKAENDKTATEKNKK